MKTDRRVLFLDIETAPNLVAVFSLKQTYINPKYIERHGYVLCWSAQWLGEKKVMFSSIWEDGYAKMIRSVHKLLKEADVVVHYNGKKFDIPTLNACFLMEGLDPIPELVQIDMLRLVKGSFNFPSYKLDYVCQRLDIPNKVPHVGYDMWRGVMKGEPGMQRMMKRYSMGDTRIMPALFYRLVPWMPVTHGFKRIHEYMLGEREKP